MRRHRVIRHVPLIDRRHFDEVVLGAGERRFHQEFLADSSFVLHRLVVAAVLIEAAEAGGVGVQERLIALRAVVPVRRVAKERRVNALRRRGLPGDLGRVRHDAAVARHVSERRQRESCRRHEQRAVALRVDGAKDEQLVMDDRTANRGAGVALARAADVDGAVHGVDLVVWALEAVRTEVAEQAAERLIRAALRDHVDDAARGLPVLGFVAARFDLRGADEIERNAVAQRPEHDRVGAERAVAGVRDVDAVDHVVVLEAAAAGNRRVRLPDLSTAGHARCDVERIADAPADRHAAQKLGIERRARGRRRLVDDRSRSSNLHRLAE